MFGIQLLNLLFWILNKVEKSQNKWIGIAVENDLLF